jgi:hypothetical protein
MISYGEEKRIVCVLSGSVKLYIYTCSPVEVGLFDLVEFDLVEFDLVEVASVRLGQSDKSSTWSK